MGFLKSWAGRFRIVAELISFLWRQRLWWLIPLIVVMLIFGFLLIFAQTSGLGPFIYTLF